MTTMPGGVRYAFLLLAFGVALVADHLATPRAGSMLGVRLSSDARDAARSGSRVLRSVVWASFFAGFFAGVPVLVRATPQWVAAGAALSILMPPLVVLLGAQWARRDARPPEQGERWWDPALHLLNLAIASYGGLVFAWVQHLLPSAAPLRWGPGGRVYGSPRALWCCLAPIALHTLGMLLIARWARRGGAAEKNRWRRYRLLKLTERSLVALNAAVVVLWWSVAFGTLPGAPAAVRERGLALALALAVGVPALSALAHWRGRSSKGL